MEDIIAMFFDFELEIPPIGAMFVELLKVKLAMLLELAAGIPGWLQPAVDKIMSLFPANFDIQQILKAIAEAIFGYFFEKINMTKIKNLIEKAPSSFARHNTGSSRLTCYFGCRDFVWGRFYYENFSNRFRNYQLGDNYKERS